MSNAFDHEKKDVEPPENYLYNQISPINRATHKWVRHPKYPAVGRFVEKDRVWSNDRP